MTTRDLLTGGRGDRDPADLVVLVTGMVPREQRRPDQDPQAAGGQDGFFNEIHPKLRPVETVVDGVFICGTCQSPKNSAESVASGLAAVTQSAAILKRGFAELDPLVAMVDTDVCTWCGRAWRPAPTRRLGDGGGRQDRGLHRQERPARAAAAASRSARRTPSTWRVTPTRRSRAMIDGLLQESRRHVERVNRDVRESHPRRAPHAAPHPEAPWRPAR